jgi:hypothetical protein
MAASTLVARSQRCHGVSAALAERLRTNNSPTGGIQASHRDPSDKYDLEMITSHAQASSCMTMLWARAPIPRSLESSASQYSKKYRLTQIEPPPHHLLCECGKRATPHDGAGGRQSVGRPSCLPVSTALLSPARIPWRIMLR